MSTFYTFVENSCFTLDKLSKGKVKNLMASMLTSSSGKEKIPSWVKAQCEVCENRMDGFSFYELRPKKNRMDKVVIFLAGGGGMSRPTMLHYDVALRIVKKTRATLYMPFYPLAPAYNASYALSWCKKMYKEILKKHDPNTILFMGDSAGANLCLGLCEKVKYRPKKLIIISPAFGLEDGYSREIRLSMENQDPILSVSMNDTIKENWAKNVPLNSSDISPEYVDYTNFPEMLWFYGSHELFYPLVDANVKEIGKKTKITSIVKPMCHDWALCSFFKEGKEAIHQMCTFITS